MIEKVIKVLSLRFGIPESKFNPELVMEHALSMMSIWNKSPEEVATALANRFFRDQNEILKKLCNY